MAYYFLTKKGAQFAFFAGVNCPYVSSSRNSLRLWTPLALKRPITGFNTMKLNSAAYLAAAIAGIVQANTASTDDSLATFATRRTADLAQFPDPTWFSKIDSWLSSQKDDGTWSDVNYLSGCPARK